MHSRWDIMRRKDREITDRERIEDILVGARYLHPGMSDGDFPYVVPLHCGYRKGNGKLTFYVHSANEGHKPACLRSDNRVFVEIDRGEALITADVPCKYGAVYESVMCRGRTLFAEDAAEKCAALSALMKTQTGKAHEINEKAVDAPTVIRIDIDTHTAKACVR